MVVNSGEYRLPYIQPKVDNYCETVSQWSWFISRHTASNLKRNKSYRWAVCRTNIWLLVEEEPNKLPTMANGLSFFPSLLCARCSSHLDNCDQSATRNNYTNDDPWKFIPLAHLIGTRVRALGQDRSNLQPGWAPLYDACYLLTVWFCLLTLLVMLVAIIDGLKTPNWLTFLSRHEMLTVKRCTVMKLPTLS